jgi:replicative DNA helicase
MSSFKESGAIEYSSDVLIGMQLKGAGDKNADLEELKKKTPREVELKILKNRNGRTGEVIDFEFYSKYNDFEEI